MTDQQRRAALKMMLAGGMVTHATGLYASAPHLANGPTAQKYNGSLHIDILSGNSIPGDSIIIRNTTSRVFHLTHFSPGVVAYQGSIIDLNELCTTQPLTIAADGLYSSTLATWQVLSTDTIGNYLCADSCASSLTDDTDLLSLAADVHRGRATIQPLIHG
ncbi:MAG: hypothetical protein AAF404_07050 [Pseudomonadota bacterium]